MLKTSKVDLTRNVETRLKLNSVSFRSYQIPIIRAIENDGYRRAVVLLPRRAGKDFLCLQIALRQALKKTCTIFYIFPTYSNARKAIWDAITIDGKRMLDFFPDQICKKNSSEMKITFINSSVIQFMGSTEYDRLRGTNPFMVIFSEYAYQNPMAYQTIRPILAANKGIAIMISTTFGKNHFYDLYQLAKYSDDWFCYRKTIEETMHIDDLSLAQERAQMSEDMFQQEYYCSFDRGVSGAVFAKILNELALNNKLSTVPWERSFPVNTAWDIGYADSTALVFFQVIGTVIHIIDYYENNQHSLDHYIKYLDTKPYKYGKHIAPHDMANHSFSTGVSRIEMAATLGVDFIVAPKLPIQDGIEASKVALAKCYIDKDKCSELIKNFNLYRYEWDDRRQMYKNTFFHGPECFTGDQKVLTPNGEVPIKDIKIGDEVITPLGIRKVLKKFKRKTSKLVKIKTGFSEIITTAGHEIFTIDRFTYANTLRYGDILEPYSKFRSYLWKKISGFYTKEQGIKGFKKIISSQKTNRRSCLMDIFIDGMPQNTTWENTVKKTMEPPMQVKHIIGIRSINMDTQHYKGIFGKDIKVKFLKDTLFIMLTGIRETTISIISGVSQRKNTEDCMLQGQVHGVSLKGVRTISENNQTKQKNGTEAKKVGRGIENMQKKHCLLSWVLNIKKYVNSVIRNMQLNKHGKCTVQIRVSKDKGLNRARTLKQEIVLFVAKSLNVINMLRRKHVVKSVQSVSLNTPKEVYDLTVEDDHCYYINGYLVSNSHAVDAFRMLAVTLPMVATGTSPEALNDRYNRAVNGSNGNMPLMFR